MGRAWPILFSYPRGFTNQATVSRNDKYCLEGGVIVIFQLSGRLY